MKKIDSNLELYIGNVYEACKHGDEFDVIINVMDGNEMGRYERDEYYANKKPLKINIPVLRCVRANDGMIEDVYVEPLAMNYVAYIINESLINGKKVLIHCAAAEERSPLCLIWYYHTYFDYTLDKAFEIIKSRHSITRNRMTWLYKCVREDKQTELNDVFKENDYE